MEDSFEVSQYVEGEFVSFTVQFLSEVGVLDITFILLVMDEIFQVKYFVNVDIDISN